MKEELLQTAVQIPGFTNRKPKLLQISHRYRRGKGAEGGDKRRTNRKDMSDSRRHRSAAAPSVAIRYCNYIIGE